MKRTRSTSKTKPSNKPETVKQPGSEGSTTFSDQAFEAESVSTPAGADDREGREQHHVPAGGRIGPVSTVQKDSASASGEEGQDPDPEAARRRIAERAYSLYVQGGREEGKALEHWLEAERELSHATEPSDHQWDH
jgi:hypothetical protein